MVQTDISVFSEVTGATVASVTTEKRIKIKNKPFVTSPPRNYPIPNHDKNNLGIKKDQSLPPHVSQFTPGFKSLINEADDDKPESTDISRTGRDDTSRTD